MNPLPLWVRKIWNAWDIRAMVLLSLILQITLFIFGRRRRSSVKSWIIFTVWIAYLAADWLATAAIAKLTEAQADSSNTISPTNQLRALWAPLIFLHLGGPDTITAYAFEDTGVIKNGERVFALISAGISHLAIISVSPWDNVDVDNRVYDKCRKWALADQFLATFRPNVPNYISVGEYVRPSLQQESFTLRFRHVSLSTSPLLDKVNSMDIIELFDIIEIELGFMFDVLYTKNNNLTYTCIGCILRCISFSCSLCTFLVFFSIIFVEEKSCHCYSDIDISITAVLLAGAVVLELYGIAMALSSDQTMLWITQHHGNRLVWKIFNSFPWLFTGHIKKRYWSNSMGQFSLLSFCFNHRPGKLSKILEMLGIDKMLRWFWHKRFLAVPPSLKPLIREKLLAKLATNYMELKWSCTGSVLVERIITWHIATDICYHDTSFSNMGVVGDNNEAKETSKILSDYMMYLLVMHPSMFLPAHHHELRLYELDQARNILTQFFKEGTSTDIRQDYTLLLRKGADSDEQDVISKVKLLAEDLLNKLATPKNFDAVANFSLTSGSYFCTNLWQAISTV
ncbi:hypothetical protein FH972_008066 [Carpinus fangiana]|uniref:DUF4220 domain-containing protein n=1 Tax=Carpinus fangiana TaxID=176857 RepID=A0A5N6QZ49_9ROSI|nr:hypothetical protein FH972_008066 [Carpinus fangiana]